MYSTAEGEGHTCADAQRPHIGERQQFPQRTDQSALQPYSKLALSMINAWPAGAKRTVKDILTSLSLPQMVVGSPETIASRLLDYQSAGVDGVQIMNALMPESYHDFFDHVVPVLQDKGLMQTEYHPGTLREKLFETPTADIGDRHPAYGYRGMFCGG
jgi:alkanesulfonate monooxygenase SsuD/methylene tetrahydromethanopterin reductase-like flavin-dependent oxidoreductase (luciferase family)